MMTRAALIAPTLALSLALSQPAAAQEAPPAPEAEQGLIDWAMSWIYGSVEQELAPALDDMRALAEQFGPAIAPAIERMMALVDDMTHYELPVMLDNGDILIRRKPDAPVVEPPADPGVNL
ncbi:MAG: hypothetical protein RIR62_339 [Pseudomonadota bacterium]